MPFRYVPILRSKAGEATALHNLDAAAKQRVFPVIRLTAAVPATFAGRMAGAWVGRDLALDGYYSLTQTGSTVPLQSLANTLTAAGVHVLPSIRVGAPAPYIAAIQHMRQQSQGRLVVLARLGDMATLDAWLISINATPPAADLVIVAGHVPDYGAGALDPVVTHSLQTLPNPANWRSITLASSAAPRDYAPFPLGLSSVSRLDWVLWQAVHPAVQFQLDYGDYGIAHPDMTEPPGVAMVRASVSAKYTLDTTWLIAKGQQVTGPMGVPMPTQYLGHANALVAQPGFGGVPNCWGDTRIQAITAHTASPGSRATWVEVGVNRHLSLVTDRLP
ncbi:MAG: hypothetical protein ACHP84_16310 [Caulobacterales bacterium]